MKKILTIIILSAVLLYSVWLYRDANALVIMGGYYGGGGCAVTSCGVDPDIACDTLEGSDAIFTLSGTDRWSFASAARGSCSDDYWIVTNPIPNDYQYHNFVDSDPTYADFWFRIVSTDMANTEGLDIAALQTDEEYACIYLSVINASGTYNLYSRLVNGGSPSNTYEISLNTWYHVGMMFDAAANTAAWFASTVDALGAAQESFSELATPRTPGIFKIGNITDIGAFDIVINYDSVGLDDDTMTGVEY